MKREEKFTMKDEVQEVLRRLKEEEIVIDYKIISSDEYVEVEVIHFSRAGNFIPFQWMCNVASTESTYCTDRENLKYETRLKIPNRVLS